MKPACLWLLLWLATAGCQATADELQALGSRPTLDLCVLLSGGGFAVATPEPGATFASPAVDTSPAQAASGPPESPPRELLAFASVLEVLQQGKVFHRVASHGDASARWALQEALRVAPGPAGLAPWLPDASAAGCDLLLVIEELDDGPIDAQGINGRWPVTLVSWLLLGLGAVIPDHTFESRARLRYSLRDLQTGQVLHDALLAGGPIDLSLLERSDWLGLLASIVVPPFWVGDDEASVRAAVRQVQQRRLLVAMARDLKSEAVRQRLRERRVAALAVQEVGNRRRVVVEARDSLSLVRLTAPGLAPAAAAAFERELLANLRVLGPGLRYEAWLPELAPGALVQVAVATIRGAVASATFQPWTLP